MISQERGGRTYTYLYDGHGSVVGLMSESGSVTDTYTYDAFGNLLKSTGRTANNYRYCGEQFDSTTGLYYLRARYMDTSTGRFISQDSYAGSVYDPVSLHKYLYANSNPVTYSDPSGYMSLAGAVTASAIQGALLNVGFTIGLNILKNLDQTGEVKITVSCGEIVTSIIFGGLLGALNSFIIVYCIELAIILAAVNGTFAFCKSIENFCNGNNYQGFGYAILSMISFSGAKRMHGMFKNGGNIPVTRWGRSGLEEGDWIMNGGKSLKNYILSFKWDPNPTNKFASMNSGETYMVPANSIQWPKHTNFFDSTWKIIFGQWQYFPESQHYDYSVLSYLYYKLFVSDNDEQPDENN